MQFSARLPIAVHIMLVIELFKDDCKVTSSFLAGSLNVNPVVIRNTIGMLKAAGLVNTKPGEGGNTLARVPEDITLLDIFNSVEKDEELFSFHDNPNPDCPVGRSIHALLDGRLRKVELAMAGELKKVTLRDLLEEVG